MAKSSVSAPMLHQYAVRINNALNLPTLPWRSVDGHLVANIGSYHIDNGNGKFCLRQMCNESGGSRDVLGGSYSKPELFGHIQSFLAGIEAGKVEPLQPEVAHIAATWLTDFTETPERKFALWLNSKRGNNVSEVFHEVMQHFAAACRTHQPPIAPEPVAYMTSDKRMLVFADSPGDKSGYPLYTAPQPAIAPEPICRTDGRCQYAIEHGAEGLGYCPQGKCCMPAVPAQSNRETTAKSK